MPRAPLLDGPTVTINPVSNVYQSGAPTAESLGSGIAQGLQNLGGDAFRIWQQAQERANASAINQAQAQADEAANKLQVQHRTTGGEDAVASIDDYKQQLADGLSDISSKTLSNEAQRRQFQEWSAQRVSQFDSALYAHAANESEKTYDADTQARKSQAINRAAINATDPAQVDAALADVRKASDDWATHRGLSDIQRQELQTRDSSAFWSTVIDQHLSDQRDLAAKQVFDAHKDEMDADTRAKLGKTLEFANSQAEAQRQATAIYSPTKTLEQMSAEADKIPDQKVQAETKQRLDRLHALHKQAVDEQAGNLLKDGLRVINTDPRGLDAIPKATLADLNQADPERYQALIATAQRLAKREDTTTKEGNAKLILASSALSGALGERAKNDAINEDFFKNAHILSRQDLREIIKLQDDAKVGKQDDGMRSMVEVANETLAANGYNPKPFDSNGKANPEAIAFHRQLQAAIADQKATTGKTPDRATIQKLASGLMMPGLPATGWFGKPTPKFMVGIDTKTPDSYLRPGVYQFTDEQVKQAQEAIRKAGGNPDDDAVRRYLNAQKPPAPKPAGNSAQIDSSPTFTPFF